MNLPWYKLTDEEALDSPSLIIYRDRVAQNIETLLGSIDDPTRLRPHIKTHKSAEVSAMFLAKGIVKFKCATIAEAEMLADTGGKDILLAHQPVGPKMQRLLRLKQAYPLARFSTLIDNQLTARQMSELFTSSGETLDYYIDVNVGMNRTGIAPELIPSLYDNIRSLPGLKLCGLHVYDGHIRNEDFVKRTEACNEGFRPIPGILEILGSMTSDPLIIVAGGTPTYSIHAKRSGVECSPGTFIYWDKGYERILQEQHYLHAALVFTRVISKPSPGLICVDLGHKAIASENPLNSRVFFLNAPDLEPVGHSEEHMIFKTHGLPLNVGDALYGIPNHVCPTIALYDIAHVAVDNHITETWKTLSRNRRLTI